MMSICAPAGGDSDMSIAHVQFGLQASSPVLVRNRTYFSFPIGKDVITWEGQGRQSACMPYDGLLWSSFPYRSLVSRLRSEVKKAKVAALLNIPVQFTQHVPK
jgi:hypothetical protein